MPGRKQGGVRCAQGRLCAVPHNNSGAKNGKQEIPDQSVRQGFVLRHTRKVGVHPFVSVGLVAWDSRESPLPAHILLVETERLSSSSFQHPLPTSVSSLLTHRCTTDGGCVSPVRHIQATPSATMWASTGVALLAAAAVASTDCGRCGPGLGCCGNVCCAGDPTLPVNSMNIGGCELTPTPSLRCASTQLHRLSATGCHGLANGGDWG